MRNLLQILNEAAVDHQAMINPVVSALRSNPRKGANGIAVDLADEWRDKITKQWGVQVGQAKTLKKADRITWYLRLSRMAIIQIYQAAFEPAKLNKLVSDYNSRCSLPFDQDVFGIGGPRQSDSINDLEHYLSLPIAAIQNYQFRFQSFREVLDDFQAFEDKWKETVKNTIEDHDCKEIIDCGGGWFWVDTEKAYCSKEAKAMGHCGNAPREGSNDTLLSMRKKIKVGEEVRWEPHLTFILASDGYLTEMKGRNNDKPVEKYFPMIVKLLRNDIVKGIRGGGYLPEHNFSLDDLPDDQRDQLIEEKPELGTILDYFNKMGVSDEVVGRMVNELSEYDLDIDSYDGDQVTVELWDSPDDFFRSVGNQDGEALIRISEGDFDDWMDLSSDDPERKLEALITAYEQIEDREVTDLLDTIAARVGSRKENAIKGLVHMFPNSISALFDEVNQEVVDLGKAAVRKEIYSTEMAYQDLNIRVEEDGRVGLYVDFRSLVYSIDAYKTDDYDGMDGFEYCAKQQSWFATEDHSDWGHDLEPEFDAEPMTEEALYNHAATSAVEHLLGLFRDENQLDFGF